MLEHRQWDLPHRLLWRPASPVCQMGSASRLKGSAIQELEKLDQVFGPQAYFDNGRLVITVARDLQGVMKVAHKLQAKVNESFGAMVEVFMEHVKQEWWIKLHEATTTMGLHKGPEIPDVQVTHIPDGIRVHPYKREHLPTVEVLLLWEDPSGNVRGHCLYTMAHPQLPTLEQVDEIFDQIEPYFAKRWLVVELRLAPPIRGEFEELDVEGDAVAHDPHVGGGVDITVLACHPHGFATGGVATGAAHVTQCQPLIFKGISDDAGRAKICFLPADINKVQVAETGRFHGTEVTLLRTQMSPVVEGPSILTIDLTPKAVANVRVHVFAMPRKLPASDESDGIIDWAAEERDALPRASVQLTPLKDGSPSLQLNHEGGGAFGYQDGGLPEGYVVLNASCGGYQDEEQTVMLLVGENDFYLPLRKM